MKVDFFIAGTMRGGTTTLYSLLQRHEEICMGDKKEIHFFDNDTYFQDLAVNYSDYHAHFKPDVNTRLIGEATPGYMYWYDAPKRMWHYNPELKIILLLRNPIERAYSHWNRQFKWGVETLSFGEAIRIEKQRWLSELPRQHRHFAYLDRGYYTEQIRRLMHFFPERNILCVRSDDLYKRQQETLRIIFDFLNVSAELEVPEEKKNVGTYGGEMQREDREYLVRVFEYEIKELERTLGWKCSDWLER